MSGPQLRELTAYFTLRDSVLVDTIITVALRLVSPGAVSDGVTVFSYLRGDNNNNNRSFNLVKTHAQPYKHIIHVYVHNEQPVSQDSNNAAHTLPRRTATTQGLARANKLPIQRR